MRKSQVLFLCVALAAAGYPARAAESASDDWQSGNLVANGTFAQGAIGAVPEGWRVKAPNLACGRSSKLSKAGASSPAGSDGQRAKGMFRLHRVPGSTRRWEDLSVSRAFPL